MANYETEDGAGLRANGEAGADFRRALRQGARDDVLASDDTV